MPNDVSKGLGSPVDDGEVDSDAYERDSLKRNKRKYKLIPLQYGARYQCH